MNKSQTETYKRLEYELARDRSFSKNIEKLIKPYLNDSSKVDIKVGDKIRVGDLETVVKDFDIINEEMMVKTEYGDFNICLVRKA